MNHRNITSMQAESVAAILKEECGWRSDDEAFVRSIIAPQPDGRPVCHEYRFIGALGFGGKFRNNGNNGNTPYVDCYPEHNTPERAAMVARANARLKSLFGPMVPPTATAERTAYTFLKKYHNDDQGLVEGWRRQNDPRWILAVELCSSYAAEIARLRARPTEEEVTRAMVCFFAHERDCRAAARAVLALFPKVET